MGKSDDDQQPVSTGRLALPDAPTSAGQARRAVAGLLAGRSIDPDQIATATLLVSEVVTNALQHARAGQAGERELWLNASVEADLLRVAVGDPSSAAPRPREAASDAESGRGMALVAALSKEWGVERDSGKAGKIVWFTLVLGT